MKQYSFVFIISSYNNENNIYNNLLSVISQTYKQWRVIYINDNSTDKTDELFHTITQKQNVSDKFHYIKNDERKFQSHNKYHAYKLVKDLEIVCILDGDDWLYHRNVLQILNQAYNTYSNARVITSRYAIKENGKETPTTHINSYPKEDVRNCMIRYNRYWRLQHLKTGFGYLFKSIPKSYLQIGNKWLDRCTDLAEMFTVVELSNGQLFTIQDTLYVYNKDNSLLHPQSYYNDKDSYKRKKIEQYIRNLPRMKYSLPNTYIINMEKEPIKQLDMKRQMTYIGHADYTWIEAIDGLNDVTVNRLVQEYEDSFHPQIQNSYLPDKPPLYNYTVKHITHSSLGLILSVRKALQSFLQTQNTHCVLLEDDVYVHKQWKNLFHINEEMLQDKDLVYLGCHNNTLNIYKKVEQNTNTTLDTFYDCKQEENLIYGTYSIILSRALAEHILSLPIEFFIQGNLSWDLALNYIRQTKDTFSYYIYQEQLFIPEVRKEGIQSKRNNSFYSQRNILLSDYLLC